MLTSLMSSHPPARPSPDPCLHQSRPMSCRRASHAPIRARPYSRARICPHLHLHQPFDDSTVSLLQAIRAAAARSHRSLVIDAHDRDTYTLRTSRTGAA